MNLLRGGDRIVAVDPTPERWFYATAHVLPVATSSSFHKSALYPHSEAKHLIKPK